MAEKQGETVSIEYNEDQQKGKPQEVELVPVETKTEDDNYDLNEASGEDARLSEDNEDREELRRKRREEKQQRAERRRGAIARDKKELDFLRQRNEALEKRMMAVEKTAVHNTISNIDARLNEKIAEVRAAERIMAQAVEAGNGEDVTKALRIRDESMKQAHQLQAIKHQQTQVAQEIHNQDLDTKGQDPEVANYAKEWVSKNPWYDPGARNEESKIVLAIDQTLVEEGYNPKLEEYWQELDKRVAKRLPNMKGGGDNDDGYSRGGRKGPPVGSSRDQAPPSFRQQVYISPERKQAMIDAGVWEDPILRQRYLKQYAKWDRENSNNATR